MNKRFVFALVFLFMVLPICMAVDVDMKENLKLGESFVIKVSGNFLDKIEFENIVFYRRHMPTVLKDVKVFEIDEDYYISGQIQETKEKDNYSMQISGVDYMVGSKISDETIIKNFTISEETAEFSVSQLIFYLNDTDSFEIQNLMESKLEIIFENLSGIGNLELKSGEIKEIEIPFKNNSGLEIFRAYSSNQNYGFYVFFGINSSFEGEVIEPEVNGSVLVDENQTETDAEVVVEEDEQGETDMEVVVEKDEEKRKSDLTCEELEGFYCIVENQTCKGEMVDSQTGECCIGKCVDKEESNTGKTIGWILIVVVIMFLTWFFKRKFKK